MILKNYTLLFAIFINMAAFAQNRFAINYENHKAITKTYIEHLNKQNKSIESTKQSLDSIFLYNSDVDSPMYKVKFTYNELGLTILEEDLGYDEESGDFVMNYSLTYDYDTSNRLVELLIFESDGDPESNDYFKSTFSYTDDDKLLQRLRYYYNETGDTWNLSRKIDYTYSEGAYEEIVSNWTADESWLYNYKDAYSLDGMDNVIENISYSWNSETSVWAMQNKNTFSYNEAGKLLLRQNYYWSSEIDDWQESPYRTQYIYDDSNRLLLRNSEEYDTETHAWFIYSQTAKTYDDYDNIVTEIRASIYASESGTDLEPSNMSTYTYNNDFTFDDLLLPAEFSDDDELDLFNHMLLSVLDFEWNSDTETWESGDENVALYYSPREIVGTSAIIGQTIGVYPNPFTSQLTFTISDISKNTTLALFDIQGRRVYNDTISNHGTITTLNLVAGVYFYNLQVDNKTYTGKVIKK